MVGGNVTSRPGHCFSGYFYRSISRERKGSEEEEEKEYKWWRWDSLMEIFHLALRMCSIWRSNDRAINQSPFAKMDAVMSRSMKTAHEAYVLVH